MDAADAFVTSKVIVQFTDPHGLLESFRRQLEPRIPLRNLHWKSSSRPLRSIESLQVSIIADGHSDTDSSSNVRRHQIPGLRQTPYAKVYLLRCDNQETYKETARKEIRQWIRNHGLSQDLKGPPKGQEQYDAFEWLVVHVVLANTPAASQPRSSKHISVEAADSTDSLNTKSKWKGKSSSTIFDKLKADFNSTSKGSIERVAQVRIADATLTQSTPAGLSPVEIEEQWQDVLETFKSSILRAFDARVARYEEDIRERDSQRNLPGWNFCTFFILKEGLAREFETAGLLEDALSIYDELETGLDAIVYEQYRQGEGENSGSLLPFSRDLKGIIRQALDDLSLNDGAASGVDQTDSTDVSTLWQRDRDRFPFDVEKRRYRELILANEVSSLDFRIYIFTRQTELLLKRARIFGLQSDSSRIDYVVLSRICERAGEVINTGARALRYDLHAAWGGNEGLEARELVTQQVLIGNIVASWKWCAIMQILSQIGAEKIAILDTVEFLDEIAKTEPAIRNSGADANISTTDERATFGLERITSSHGWSGSRNVTSDATALARHPRTEESLQPGHDQWATWTANLLLMARAVLTSLEATKQNAPGPLDRRRGSCEKSSRQAPSQEDDRREVAEEVSFVQVGDREHMAGLNSAVLQAIVASETNFTHIYKTLTALAYQCFLSAKSMRSAGHTLRDLARIELMNKRYDLAVKYFDRIPELHEDHERSNGDISSLKLYGFCLMQLNRSSDYARVLLSILGLYSNVRQAYGQDEDDIFWEEQLDQLMSVSTQVKPMSVSLSTLFVVDRLSPTVSHVPGRDGFCLHIMVYTLNGSKIPVSAITASMLAVSEGVLPTRLQLKANDSIVLDGKGKSVELVGSVTTQGWYRLESLQITLGNLIFNNEYPASRSVVQEATLAQELRLWSPTPIYLYPRKGSLDIKAMPSPIVDLNLSRLLIMQIDMGDNEIHECQLRLKSATAGLRLDLHSSKSVSKGSQEHLDVSRVEDSLMLAISGMQHHKLTEIEIPFNFENTGGLAIAIKAEITYKTEQGHYALHKSLAMTTILPIAVNMQDIFQDASTFFRFTITPATLVPLRILDCTLPWNVDFEIDAGRDFETPMDVFPKQVVSWIVRVTRKPVSTSTGKASKVPMVVVYQPLDEVLLAAVERRFNSAIIQSPFEFASGLLCRHLLQMLRTTWTEHDLEVAGLLQEIDCLQMHEMDWDVVLAAFDAPLRVSLEQWLQSWHSRNRSIPFSSADGPVHQLKLLVEVPQPRLIISTYLAIEKESTAVISVSQPLAAQLVFTSVCAYGAKDGPIEAAFEIAGQAEMWLIGGKRKGTFFPLQGRVSFPIILFPQRPGQLLLPAIAVKCRKQSSEASPPAPDAWTEVPCEIENKSQARSLRVIHDLRAAVIELTDDEGMEGSSLADGNVARPHVVE